MVMTGPQEGAITIAITMREVRPMRLVTRLVTLFVACAALLLTLMPSAAVAQDGRSADIRSAKAMLPHCTAGLKPDAQDMAGGRCAGIMTTLSFVSRVLPDNLKFCHPSAATPEQMLQVIESFVEANPDAG